MDVSALSEELLETLYRFYKIKPQKQITNAMHGEAFALHFIAAHADIAAPSDIESAMSISSARIATILNGLENKGLITRRIAPSDRRRTLLALTAAGEAQAAADTQQLLGLMTDIFDYLGEDDARAYVRIMGRLADRYSGDT